MMGSRGGGLKSGYKVTFQLFIKTKLHMILNPKLLHIGTGDYDFSSNYALRVMGMVAPKRILSLGQKLLLNLGIFAYA